MSYVYLDLRVHNPHMYKCIIYTLLCVACQMSSMVRLQLSTGHMATDVHTGSPVLDNHRPQQVLHPQTQQ